MADITKLLKLEHEAIIACEKSGEEWDYDTVIALIVKANPMLDPRDVKTALAAHYDRLNGFA